MLPEALYKAIICLQTLVLITYSSVYAEQELLLIHNKTSDISVEKWNDAKPSIKLEGSLAPKYVLDKAFKILEGELYGAESILLNGSILYTGTTDGKLLQIIDNQIENSGTQIENIKQNKALVKIIARFGKRCKGNKKQICNPGVGGGIRFDSEGNIVLVDMTYGILRANPIKRKWTYLFTTETPISNGVRARYPDDFDIAKDGIIYWSEATTEYGTHEFPMETCVRGNGRLLRFDPKTKINTVLLNGLYFANGVQLSENEDFVLVSETCRARVIRYYLKGPKKGSSDVFLEGLPGLPDNIRENGKGGYYIPLAAPRDILDKPFENCTFLEQSRVTKNGRTVVVDVDSNGKIIQILTTTNEEMKILAQLTIGKEYAYLGGIWSKEIWKININDLEEKQDEKR